MSLRRFIELVVTAAVWFLVISFFYLMGRWFRGGP